MRRHTLSLFALLAIFWMANSGYFSPLLLSFGFLSVLFVVLIARRMRLVDRESQPLHLARGLPAYYCWLFGKILRSNLDVVVRVWKGPGAVGPTSARLPVNLRSDLARVLYANSITLTPGTVSISLEGNEILVHALTAEGIDDLLSGEMEERVRALEK